MKKFNIIIPVLFIVLILVLLVAFSGTSNNVINKIGTKEFNIISSIENKDLEEIILSYANKKGYDVNIEYAGTLDIMQKLKNGESYDAVWISNSIWLYMLDDEVSLKNSKYTSINPVVFGITKDINY